MKCSRESEDPLLKELVKKYGMNLLIPPAPSIDPGDLIVGYADGTARKAAWISIIGIQPTPDYDAHAAPTSMAFVVSRRMDVKAGLSLTGRILESFGLTATKADATFSKTAALKLHMEIIAPSQRVLKNLDQVIASLAAPELTANAAFKDRQLYVVTRTYRAKGLRIMLYDKEGGVVKSSGSVSEELRAGVNLSVGADMDGSYSFKSPTDPLVFGITLRKLVLRDGVIRDESPTTYLGLRGADEEAIPCEYISVDDAFVELTQGE